MVELIIFLLGCAFSAWLRDQSRDRFAEYDLPWKVPEPSFLQRKAAEWDYMHMNSGPADKRGIQ